jgi:uroporphyrinogen decarboxylase
MTSKERIELIIKHKEADRIPIMDTIWETTISRWHQEGLPADKGPYEYFGYDAWYAIGADITLQLTPETIEENDEYIIARNSDGAINKYWKKSTSTPQLIDFLIKTRKKWEEYKERSKYNESRVNFDGAIATYKSGIASGYPVQYFNGVGYDWWQRIVGPVNMMMGMIENPEWIKEMFKANTDLNITIMEEMIAKGVVFDSAFFWDDLGYRNGTLFSPAMYRELLFPYHKRLCDFCNARGIYVVLHSCGNVNALMPMFIEAGFSCLQPLETKSGMDLFELKKNYGEYITLMGGIDVRTMALGGEALEKEVINKITFAKKGGGYIYHSDHSVPDNVSFSNYSKVISLAKEYGKYNENHELHEYNSKNSCN